MAANSRYVSNTNRIFFFGIIVFLAYIIVGGFISDLAMISGFVNVFAGCGLIMGTLFLAEGLRDLNLKGASSISEKVVASLKIVCGAFLALSEVILLSSFKVLNMIGWSQLFLPLAVGATVLFAAYRFSSVSQSIADVMKTPKGRITFGIINTSCLLGSLIFGGLNLASYHGVFLSVLYISTAIVVGGVGFYYLFMGTCCAVGGHRKEIPFLLLSQRFVTPTTSDQIASDSNSEIPLSSTAVLAIDKLGEGEAFPFNHSS